MTESASVLNAINERLITPRIPVGCFPDEDAVCEEGRQTVEGWADRRTALRTLDAQLLSDRVAKVRRELSYNLDRLGRDLDCVGRGLVPRSDTARGGMVSTGGGGGESRTAHYDLVRSENTRGLSFGLVPSTNFPAP